MRNAKLVIDFCFTHFSIMRIFNVALYHTVTVRTQCIYFAVSEQIYKWKQREVLEERHESRYSFLIQEPFAFAVAA